ncbi:hypothetical protein G7Y79_00082g100760 [Physcia stellaris]|nr:hypothetical protein G7Y79_00082g100760 [Physcia stellaris]
MASLQTAAKAALVFLSAAGYYATWYFLLHNGTTDHMARIRDVGARLLSGTKEPFRTIFTGIPAVDNQLTSLTLFYWELVNGFLPTGSLFCFYFATQIAFLLPIWCIAHLSLSQTVDSRRLADYMISVPDLAGIPIAMVFAYIYPTMVMSLPAPSVLSYDLKQYLVVFWQFFPFWVSLVQGIVAYLLPTGLGEEEEASKVRLNIIMMRWMRPLYAGLLTAATLGQSKTLSLVWTSIFLPGLFASEFRGVFDFSKVFVPAATSPFTPMQSIGAGALLFLQYDYFVTSASMALWSTVLFVTTYRNGTTRRRLAVLFAGGLGVLVVSGPMGYATVLLWARDELIVAEAADDGKNAQ